MPTVIEHVMLRRRTWLTASAALALNTSFPVAGLAAMQPARLVTVLTAWDSEGQSWAGTWSPGTAPHGLVLPARAHEVLPVPGRNGQALVVARRPGEYLVRMDTRRARALQWHDMEPDRLLCGHAAFSLDGATLFTTETDTDTGMGIIAVRDPVTLRKRREFSSGGIGPHALLVEPQGSLLVANGGLLTLPETGRRKLNQDRMDSSIARLDADSGQVMQSWRLDDPFLSLRHLARAPDGTVAVALQAEHADSIARRNAPLLALLDNTGLNLAAPSENLVLEGYAGDVAFVASSDPSADAGGRFIVSATRAGQLAWWSAKGHWSGNDAFPEAGALSAADGEWLACGAEGRVHIQTSGGPINPFQGLRLPKVKWDNHARRLV